MKIIFMGTPEFSVGTLKSLIEAEHEITLVVTQPDKPKGRGHQMQMSPVKEFAIEQSLPLFQPIRMRNKEKIAYLKEFEADVIVVVAYGQILPKEILDFPKFGCINVHASLLPKYRGAAPIQWAVINGDEKTGVTIQRMDEGIDTGDIILEKEIQLEEKETGGSLFLRLETVGASACVEALDLIESNQATYHPQENEQASFTTLIHKKMGEIDFSQSKIQIERLIRGLNPWPSAFTFWSQKNVKLWSANVREDEEEWVNYGPGMVCQLTKELLVIKTIDGGIQINELQMEGKKRMSIADFLRGNNIQLGDQLGRK